MFNGVFRTLKPDELAALCSCFIPTEKVQQEPKLEPRLAESLDRLREAAKQMGEVQADAKLEIDLEEYVDSFKPSLMAIVYGWVRRAAAAPPQRWSSWRFRLSQYGRPELAGPPSARSATGRRSRR